MARRKKPAEKPQPSIESRIARATTRLAILSQIIDGIADGSTAPSDALYRAYDVEDEFEKTQDEHENDFTYDELGEILLPGLRAAQQRYLAKVAELVAVKEST